MTKFVKMSLAAAVAVAGFNTAASAGSLEEAIKGTEVSGYVDYRKENKSIEDGNDQDVNEYSVNVTLTSKVNDIVSATVSAGFDEIRTLNDGSIDINNDTKNEADADKDTTATLSVDQAYFTFNLGSAAVMAGKQNIPSAFVDQSDTVKQGAGIVASTNVAETLTIAAAHFWNNNIAADTKTSELVVAGSASIVNYGLNYNFTDLAGDEQTRYTVNVGAEVAKGIKIGARYAASDIDSLKDDSSAFKIDASAKFGIVKVSALYFSADEDASKLAIDGDDDAAVEAKLWQLSSKNLTEGGDIYVLGVNVALTDTLSADVKYGAGDGDEDSLDQSEIFAALTYKMSKNFFIHGRYSVLSDDKTDKDTDFSRIQVKYTF